MAGKTLDSYIRRFSEIRSADVSLVGGKGANLGEMTGAGLTVPPGYCVTAQAYRAFIADSGSAEKIRSVLTSMRLDSPEDVEVKTAQIRSWLVAQVIPPDIREQILQAYHELAKEMGNPTAPVAVRSSATAEDLPSASFAGQQDTYLNIRGDDKLLAHVKQCWASLWTARAVTYRSRQGFDHEKVALAVVVQAMVESAVSGILFTANPVNGNRDEIVINASWGLGEAIVSGMVTPDTITVRKSSGTIISREIATKDIAVEYGKEGSTVQVDVPAERKKIPALTELEIIELVNIGRRIEEHYRAPMDIEWGCANGKMFVLQARPITTLQAAPHLAVTGEYNRTMFLEIFPDALSPAFLSTVKPLFRTMLDFTFETLGVRPPKDIEAIGIFHNQIYFHREYVAAALQGFRPALRDQLLAQMVNPFGKIEREVKIDLSPAALTMVTRLLGFMRRFPSQMPQVITRFRRKVAEVERLDIAGMKDSEIFARIVDLVFGTLSRLINYDFLMITLIRITYQMLGGWLHRYFGEESEEIRTKLVSGVTGNVTMETNKRLWDLAEIAKSLSPVRAALRAGTYDIRARLEETKEGRAFLAEFDHFLTEYGHREFKMDILYPTWVEDPTPVFGFLRSYLDLDPNASPHKQEERLAKQREELALAVEAHVKRDPIGRFVLFPIFHRILVDTQTHTRERDTMHFEFTRVLAPFRGMLLELGRRWSSKHFVDQPEDVFFLTLDEIDSMTRSPKPMMDRVKKRREELERSRQRTAPPVMRDGQAVAAEPLIAGTLSNGEYRGIAGSPGVVTGVVRIVCGPEEFDKLERGEIMVAPLTNPVWTPLFAVAGGIITEVGGILSHGAIVAREYGIPAVMAVANATNEFKDGERVTVDGSRGVVIREATSLPA